MLGSAMSFTSGLAASPLDDIKPLVASKKPDRFRRRTKFFGDRRQRGCHSFDEQKQNLRVFS
jgi:hypothetical protein